MSEEIQQADKYLVFDSCDALRIFPNEGGTISLQQHEVRYGEDTLVTIPTHYVELVVKALRKAKREIDSAE